MAVFSKKETLTQNITYMALMAAINVIFVLLTTLVPFLLFLLVFILPFTSLVVAYFCKKRYFIIYALATVLLCIVTTIWNFQDTLFYVVPSIFSGFVFAFLIEEKVPPIFIILVTTIVQAALTYPMIPLIQLIYERDIVYDFINVFGLSEFAFPQYLKHIFIFILALIQEVFSFIIIQDELKRVTIEIYETDNEEVFLSILIGVFSLFLLLFTFIFPEISYIFVIMSLFVSVYLTATLLLAKKTIVNVLIVISLIITFLLVAALFNVLNENEPLGLITLIVYPILVAVISLLNKYLFINIKPYKIDGKE